MAQQSNMQLPCDVNGVCMVCKYKPLEIETIECRTCTTPWHIQCLSLLLSTILEWICIDCSQPLDNIDVPNVPAPSHNVGGLIDGSSKLPTDNNNNNNDVFDIINGICSFCMFLPQCPITTSCGHNFCLKCFEKWVKKGKHTCSNCRAAIPAELASDPQVNSQMANAIQIAEKVGSEKKTDKILKIKDKILKEFNCKICRKVLNFPITTPCGHNFCKVCLESTFSRKSFIRNRETQSKCVLRTKKNIMKCPKCSTNIADYLQNPQVNREMMNIIEALQHMDAQMKES